MAAKCSPIDPFAPLPSDVHHPDFLCLLQHQQRVMREMTMLVEHYSVVYERLMTYLQTKEK